MKLTPLDIKKQEFTTAFRGYDRLEVETFLEMVSEQLESAIREKNQLADEILRLKTQLSDYQDVEKTLKETLMHAQQNISDSKETSRREAEMLIRDAEIKAEKIIEEARLKLAELKNELIVVKAQKDSFSRRLRHLLISQLDLLEVLEMDDLGFEKIDDKRVKRYKQNRKSQEEIEFEGVDDAFPAEERAPDGSSSSSEQADDEWQANDRQEQNDYPNHQQDEKEESEKKARISDKLIY